MLSNLSEQALHHVLRLYNTSWMEGTIPDPWRHSIVIPMLKDGKDPTRPDSYRPISLTSHLCKLMESMVVGRLRWYLESKKHFHPSQSGFRQGRSTLDHILRLHDTVYKALNNQRSVLAVFLDIEKAYDMVWRNGLLIKLHKLGIQGNMLKWIRSFLSNRSFQVRIGNTLSDTFKIDNGIPQGSVISPILFAVMMNDLPSEIGMENALFADNCAVWKVGYLFRRSSPRSKKP